MFLTPEEIAELTGRKVRKCQRSVLNHMGIEHKCRPDGSIVVLRSHVETCLGNVARSDKLVKSKGPNWAALNA